MGTKTYNNYEDLLTFTRASGGHALRPVSYGTELVTNGTFDSDSDWQKGTGWSISGGGLVATSVASFAASYQGVSFTAGKIYKVSYDVTELTAGGVRLKFVGGTEASAPTRTAAGSYVDILVANAGNIQLYVQAANGGFTGTIDNVSVKEVLFDQPDGTLTLFEHPTNIPRVEYDADGNRLGLLVEEQRINLLTYSEDFSQWTGFSDANQIVAPDGTLTATKARDDNQGTNAAVTLNEPVTVNTSTTYTYSVFGKKGQLNWMALGIINFTTPSNGRVWFDLDSGVVGTQGSGLSGAIEEFPNGWYRCSVTFTTDASDTSGQLYIYLCEGDNQFSNTNRDGTSDLYVWGAQLEEGSFPTSYIKNEGTSGGVTRSADVASIPVADFGYNQSAGSLVVEASKIGPSGNSYSTLLILREQSGGITNRAPDMGMGTGLSGNAGIFRVDVFDGGTAQATLGDLQSFSTNTFYKGGVALKENSMVSATNGSIGTEDTSGTVPYADVLEIGNRNGSQHMNGHIKSIKYYPRRLTNAQLQALTEPRSDATLSLTFDGLESSFTENYIHG